MTVPSCRDATRMISDALDRPLPLGRRLWLRLHLLLCTPCRRFSKHMKFLRAALRHYLAAERAGRPAVPAALSPEARTRIRRALEREAP
jgi:hypothetical protein